MKTLLKYGLLATILFLVVLTSMAQKYFRIDQHKADSLEDLLISVKGIDRVDALNKLANEYAWQKAERSELLSDEALVLSTKLDYNKGIGLSHQSIGYREFLNGESTKAVDHLLKALKIFEELGEKYQIALTNQTLATTYLFSGEGYTEELNKYGLKALEYYMLVGDRNAVAAQYIAFAGVLVNMAEDPEAAKEWIDKYLTISDSVELTNIETGVGIAIAGDIAFALGEHRKGIHYYLKSRKVYDDRVVEERAIKAQQSAGLGLYYSKMGIMDTSFMYLDSAIRSYSAIGYLMAPASAYYRKGIIFESMGKFEEAIDSYDSAIYFRELISKYGSYFEPKEYRDFISWSYEIYRPSSGAYKKNGAQYFIASANLKISNIYEKLGKHTDALFHYKNFLIYIDSTSQYSQKSELEELQTRFETERKDRQITLLSQQNELNTLKVKHSRNLFFILIVFAVIIVGVAMLLNRQNKLKSDQHTVLLEQKLLRSQMNPHFIYNALSNISNLIDKKDNVNASDFLNRFSKLIHHILESTRNHSIGLYTEIKNLENYLSLQKLRFAEKFDFTIEVDKQIEVKEYHIPPMLIQPFVENAIEHGIKPKQEKGHIDIRFRLRVNQIICEVDDDGIGRKKAAELSTGNHKSMATSIINDRIATLKRKLKQDVSLEIIDLETETGDSLGTKIKIYLPIMKQNTYKASSII